MSTKKLRQLVSELLDMFPVTPPTRCTLVSCLMVMAFLSFTAPTGAQISTSTNSNDLTLTDLTTTPSEPELKPIVSDYQTLHSQQAYVSRDTHSDIKYSELKITPTNSQENSKKNNNLIVVNNKVLKRTHNHRRRNNQRESVRHAHDRKRRKHVSDFSQDDDEDGQRYVTGSSVSRGPVKHEKRRLPKALIIGAKKGGTRALLEFLRMHPDVKAPGPEIHYFDKHYSRGQQWYRNQMPSTSSGQLTIEKTPSYMVTKDVPRRIYSMSNQTRLIVVLRDPVTRAISDYTQTASKFSGTKRFEDLAFLDNSTGAVDTSWSALRIGIYAIHLTRWLDYFPLSQIHFVSGERLITDPAGEIARVQQFLGLEPIITEKHFLLDTEKGFPCLRKHGDSGRPHCLGKTKGRKHPDVAPRLLKRLRDFYRPFNIKLYKMVGQNFGWE